MARIRSIHPGQWTDEAFVSCSPFARLLALAIRNEADDQGAFEWKPLQIKMRLLPADNVDVSALLAELEAANLVRRYEHEGRQFGAIRNFTRYQSPKKPKFLHPIPDECRTYTGSSPPGSPPPEDEEPSVPPKEEPAAQRDIGEGKGGGERKEYRFVGRSLRLTAADYDGWRRQFHAIADFEAELGRIDMALAEERHKKPFVAASAMLNAKHQKLVEARVAATAKRGIGPG